LVSSIKKNLAILVPTTHTSEDGRRRPKKIAASQTKEKNQGFHRFNNPFGVLPRQLLKSPPFPQLPSRQLKQLQEGEPQCRPSCLKTPLCESGTFTTRGRKKERSNIHTAKEKKLSRQLLAFYSAASCGIFPLSAEAAAFASLAMPYIWQAAKLSKLSTDFAAAAAAPKGRKKFLGGAAALVRTSALSYRFL
jgi:hypothetical protein